MNKIPIIKPIFGTAEKKAVAEVLDSGWVVQGPKVAEFEKRFANYTGARYAIAATSCTTALHLALRATSIQPGDEVIVPAFTFIATANVVEYLNARPVFIDINLSTFNIDIDQLNRYLQNRARSLNGKTKAIIPVHLFGLSADMNSIRKISRRYRLKIVEDAACAVGTEYHRKHIGTFGAAGCFSFHPRKAITTGEGGMIVTNDLKIKNICRALRDHGAELSDLTRHKKGAFALPEYKTLGYNYRMTDIQAAIGIEQMKRLDAILKKRIQLAERYNQSLSGLKNIILPIPPGGYRHTYQSYVLLIKDNSPCRRDEIARRLAADGIATRQGTHAVVTLDYYRKKYGLNPADYPNACRADKQTLTLPLYQTMTGKEQNKIINSLIKLLK
ncbi:MAG: DegT/DnrJ/EryC1/StrS family aminotransferase [Planctomycetota bacterium]